MAGNVVLFIVEGPTDKDALIPYIEQEFIDMKLKTTVQNSLNKKQCLKTMFYFENIELIKNNPIPFKIIFFAKHLEHIIVDEERDHTDEEKIKIAMEFGEKL